MARNQIHRLTHRLYNLIGTFIRFHSFSVLKVRFFLYCDMMLLYVIYEQTL